LGSVWLDMMMQVAGRWNLMVGVAHAAALVLCRAPAPGASRQPARHPRPSDSARFVAGQRGATSPGSAVRSRRAALQGQAVHARLGRVGPWGPSVTPCQDRACATQAAALRSACSARQVTAVHRYHAPSPPPDGQA
jgi:hypothetical protein